MSAVVLATIAVTGGRPAPTSAGNVTIAAPPTTAAMTPPANAGGDEQDDVQEVHSADAQPHSARVGVQKKRRKLHLSPSPQPSPRKRERERTEFAAL